MEERRVSFLFKRLLFRKGFSSSEVPSTWWSEAIPVRVTASTEKEAQVAVMEISGAPDNLDMTYIYKLESFEQLGYLTSPSSQT